MNQKCKTKRRNADNIFLLTMQKEG